MFQQICTHFLEDSEAVRKSYLGIHTALDECLTAQADPSCRRFVSIWSMQSPRAGMPRRWLGKVFPQQHHSIVFFSFTGTGLRESLLWVWSRMSFLLTACSCGDARVMRRFDAHAKGKDLQDLCSTLSLKGSVAWSLIIHDLEPPLLSWSQSVLISAVLSQLTGNVLVGKSCLLQEWLMGMADWSVQCS